MCASYGSTLNYSSAAFVPLTLRSAEKDIQPLTDLRGCIQIVRQRMKRSLSYDAAGRSSELAGMQRAERKVEHETPIWTKKCPRFCLRRLSVGRNLRNEMVAQRRRGSTDLFHRPRSRLRPRNHAIPSLITPNWISWWRRSPFIRIP